MDSLGKGKFVEIPAGRLACQSGVLVAGDYFAVFQEFDAVYFQGMAAGSEDEAHPPEFFKISGRNGPVQITPFRGYRCGGPVSYNDPALFFSGKKAGAAPPG